MELEDTMRDGIGLPYRPPPPVRSAADRAAEAASSSSSSSRSKSKSKSKSKSRDKEVDMEDMDGVLPNGGGNGDGLGQGQGLGPELSMYAQGGLAEDQVAFCGWRIPDARRVVGVGAFASLLYLPYSG